MPTCSSTLKIVPGDEWDARERQAAHGRAPVTRPLRSRTRRRHRAPLPVTAAGALYRFGRVMQAMVDAGGEVGFGPMDEACARRPRFSIHRAGPAYVAITGGGEPVGRFDTFGAAYRAAARAVGAMA